MSNLKKYEIFQGFENINKNNTAYEQILEGMFNEMRNRLSDEDANNPNYLRFYNLVKTGGKWDHKPKLKQIAPKYSHKTNRYIKGEINRPATIFATKIKGDDNYLYDHDIWANIHYGYAGRKSNYNNNLLKFSSQANDVARLGFPDKEDTAAVEFGIMLFDKYGDKITKEALERELFANRDKFRRYKKEDLIPKNSNPLTRDVSTWSEDDIKDVMRMPEYKYDKGINNKVQDYFEKRYPEKIISGGGDVHVSGYTRRDDGKSVSVSDYYRSRPNR